MKVLLDGNCFVESLEWYFIYVDNREVIFFLFLDFIVVFDMIKYFVFLNVFELDFGVSDIVLKWFDLFLFDCK